MATSSGAKAASYILVIPSPPPPPSPPLSPHPLSFPPLSPPNQYDEKDRHNRKRKDATWLPATNCNCLLSFCAGLGLAALLVASIAVPLMITLSTSKPEVSSTESTTISATTLSTTIATSTTSTVTAVSTMSTVPTTSITISSTTTLTTTTTDLSCSPACNSQQTCVKGSCVGIGYLSCTLTWSRIGDGDIVVATPNNNIICYNNKGPSMSTDQGRLDVDNVYGTGPENVFWSNSSSVPPTGTYYVCFSQYSFTTSVSSTYPITATVKVVRSTNTILTFTKTFTSYYKDYSTCNSTSDGFVGSFNYP